MLACASIDARKSSAIVSEDRPLVLVDGVPDPSLTVREYRTQGPLDRREAVVVSTQRPSQVQLERWRSACIRVVLPLRLSDEQMRLAVLVSGKAEATEANLEAGRDESELLIADAWNRVLEAPLATVWTDDGATLLYELGGKAVMRADLQGNRSTAVHVIAGRSVHVPSESANAWTVETVLQTLAAFAGFDWSLHLLPPEIRSAPLTTDLDLSRPLGELLRAVFQVYGLVIQRDVSLESNLLIERCAVRSMAQGRTVRLSWAGDGEPLGQVLQVTAERPEDGAQPWIARAGGKLVESTFDLVHGWDAALEGQGDEVYSRSHDSFAQYANVYRHWVLNEDGQFTAAPFSQGAAFDLGAFFEDAPISPQPRKFLSCLTLDDANRRRAVLVQMSLDSGATWTNYSGGVSVRADRCAIYLDDATLPAAFLAAAKANTAAIRVTATIQSPKPFDVLRWRGNPFAGTLPPQVLDVRDTFAFARVDKQSIHATGLAAGSLSALQSDPRDAMSQWLLARVQRETLSGAQPRGRAKLTVAGAWPLLRAGDRLVHTGGRDLDTAGRAQAIAAQGALVQALRCLWPGAVTRAALSDGVRTAIDLTF